MPKWVDYVAIAVVVMLLLSIIALFIWGEIAAQHRVYLDLPPVCVSAVL